MMGTAVYRKGHHYSLSILHLIKYFFLMFRNRKNIKVLFPWVYFKQIKLQAQQKWYYMKCSFTKLHLHRPPQTMQLVQHYLTVQENDFDRFEKPGCLRNKSYCTHLTKNEPKTSKFSMLKENMSLQI